ncbi:MAG: CRISPR-associated RAMP family protein [Paludibacter sp. 47-17]|nr:MAG: CRISPR-associated RAMP family protein [Paludibacter sp. 47-17]
MKKGILISRQTKKGYDYLIEYDNGKTIKMDIRQLSPSSVIKDILNQSVEFDNSGGTLSKIWLSTTKELIYESKKQDIRSHTRIEENRDKREYNTNMNDPARAPYNFVPLNKNIIESNGKNKFSIFEGLSGHIDIQIESKSPLFIRDGDNLFANNNNSPYIPGSSLRGLIRNLVNITSFGKLDQFNNRTLFRRSNMLSDGKNVNSGFLQFKNGIYVIYEATAIQSTSDYHLSRNPHSYQFDTASNICKFSVGEFQNRCRVWIFTKTANCINVPNEAIKGYELDDTRSEYSIDILKSLKKRKIVNNNEECIGNVTVPVQLGIPVFYRIDEKGNVLSFGHAKYHRIPYNYSIGDHIIQDNNSKSDFSQTIFGTINEPSKVFFEDSYLNGSPYFELISPKHPKILSSPKATTHQHYLEQPNINTSPSHQKKWSDKDTLIRGYKNYWHRKTSSSISDPNTWIETEEISRSNPNEINPISINSVFGGRIRFENLTNEELGALLFALELPDGCCHKLGMGKPLGLGSVLLSIKSLSIIDRKERYTTLIENSSWALGVTNNIPDTEHFKNIFAKYLCSQLKEVQYVENKGSMCIWQIDRLLKLKEMLTLNHEMNNTIVNWNKRTRYMENGINNGGNNEFKNRPVLPNPNEVIQNNIYKKL